MPPYVAILREAECSMGRDCADICGLHSAPIEPPVLVKDIIIIIIIMMPVPVAARSKA